MKLKLALAVLLLQESCDSGTPKDTSQVLKTSNPKFEVRILFEVDGCKVYRFYDDEYRYFVNCPSNTSTSWTEKKTNTTTDTEGNVHVETESYPKFIIVEKEEKSGSKTGK